MTLSRRLAPVIVVLATSACARLPPVDLGVPAPLPDLVAVQLHARGELIQIGHPRLEGDSILIAVWWPDNRLGWRVGNPVRIRTSEIRTVVSLAAVETSPWELLSTQAEDPVPWYDVYLFEMNEPPPSSCVRVAIVFQSGGPAGLHETIEQVRTAAGRLGANALHFSSLVDPVTGETVSSPLFGPDWDYPAALALRCPALPPRP